MCLLATERVLRVFVSGFKHLVSLVSCLKTLACRGRVAPLCACCLAASPAHTHSHARSHSVCVSRSLPCPPSVFPPFLSLSPPHPRAPSPPPFQPLLKPPFYPLSRTLEQGAEGGKQPANARQHKAATHVSLHHKSASTTSQPAALQRRAMLQGGRDTQSATLPAPLSERHPKSATARAAP